MAESGLPSLWAREYCLPAFKADFSPIVNPSDWPQLKSWQHDEHEQRLQAQTLYPLLIKALASQKEPGT